MVAPPRIEIESELAARIRERGQETIDGEDDDVDVDELIAGSITKRNDKRKVATKLRSKAKKLMKLRAARAEELLAAELAINGKGDKKVSPVKNVL